jgi:phospholipase/carboxylesterase
MNKKELSLHHLIRAPKVKTETPPVVFMLHGYGSNEEDLFSFAPELPDEVCIISVRAPYTLVPFGYAWYHINFDAEKGKWSDDEQAKNSRDLLITFIEEACKTYRLDEKKVTLLGFSQGSVLSYAVAISYPEKVKYVIALSGYINEKIIVNNYKHKNHSNLHFYCSHGSLDQVIPVDWARKTAEALAQLHIDYVYEEFPVGHTVSPQNFYACKNWIIQHHKHPT